MKRITHYNGCKNLINKNILLNGFSCDKSLSSTFMKSGDILQRNMEDLFFGDIEKVCSKDLTKTEIKKYNLIKICMNKGQKFHGVSHAPDTIYSFMKKRAWLSKSKINLEYDNSEDIESYYNKYIDETVIKLKSSYHGKNIILGGDHSISMATVYASIDKNPDTKVLWIDAHPDLNNPSSSPTGNYHGMSLGLMCGFFEKSHPLYKFKCLDTNNLAFMGLRDLDIFEKEMIKKHNILNYMCEDINDGTNNNIYPILKNLDFWARDSPLHVSFDIDSIDPSIAPGTGTPVKRGLNECQVKEIIQFIKNKNWQTFEMVEVNPSKDLPDERTSKYAASIVDYLLE